MLVTIIQIETSLSTDQHVLLRAMQRLRGRVGREVAAGSGITYDGNEKQLKTLLES